MWGIVLVSVVGGIVLTLAVAGFMGSRIIKNNRIEQNRIEQLDTLFYVTRECKYCKTKYDLNVKRCGYCKVATVINTVEI